MSASPALEHSLRRMAAQETLFAPRPNRLQLLGLSLDKATGPARRINIWRNHAIETLLTLAQPYLDWADLALEPWLSGYDDSLSFAEHAPAELELLWLDASRLPADAGWLNGRIAALRAMSRAPILVLATASVVASGPDVQSADLAAVCEAAGVPLLDARLAKVAGSPLSAAAQSVIARELACRWLPALLLPPVKAVAVDLDHTLYAGVLGEDGPDGVQLTPGHAELQGQIKALRERGIFIALVSRNEQADVKALFETRADFPLRWDDFSVTEVSWGDKAEALQRVAQALNIDVSAVAFVDDNPGELAQVASRLPTLRSVFAHADAALTARVLAHLPALWRWRVSAEDAKRVDDQRANAQRAELASVHPEAYFESLGVKLRFSLNDASRLARMAEMSGKTNQFNLALARLGEADYAARLADPAGSVVTIELADRFSDSGVIGLLAARQGSEGITVDELLISCRAMGRRLEDSIVIGALQCLPAASVRFVVTEGPRNQPARQWLGETTEWPADRVQSFTPPDGVQIERVLP
ncbi:FkbH-like protein [Pelomonas saccharophila]|uniref:FkbH-like protein n=1 Tax=Roseateles saccharophilus TaxID=304 RepID=A0ABU1YTI8_ROSSA|nr:HAD-IIIC family phosphatase [Roseateles saccharophilus]MDR7272183.1 FkbH-like protein [Roseateles saccharophilus]